MSLRRVLLVPVVGAVWLAVKAVGLLDDLHLALSDEVDL